LGLENLDTVKSWNRNGSSCTLRFEATEKCTFLREEERKEDTSASSVSTSGIFGNWSLTSKEQRKVKYYYWKFELEYELFLFPGNNPKEKVCLLARFCIAAHSLAHLGDEERHVRIGRVQLQRAATSGIPRRAATRLEPHVALERDHRGQRVQFHDRSAARQVPHATAQSGSEHGHGLLSSLLCLD
jgi:hypothetical protein